ncbi:hypothetical protein AOL_s00006g85 [Orbilia oligospora ATCC 24927]|uniref:Cryptic loci regulator 2 N-terminal domain-containing protein n=2 Tax=Orbilia oligospora TaxID=2813651 RepID=G1WZN4_ARTOA|nr:hypothetical protein AOL_s00006g85 [Orbilia oligospora ATCC 24927]EGX53627.1 hypothetical protein AOL_s00006g85 [Orbilia oligospora ATCC 24927]KAF3291024.1 hypothetical protein TWF970_000276 [Orbilia oligospora]
MAKDTEPPKWRILVSSGQSDGNTSARPDPQQLKPGAAVGHLVEVSHNMVLDVLWRQMLGTLYMEKVCPEEHAKHQWWVLEALPANYQLYTHRKPNPEKLTAKQLASTGLFFGLRAGNSNLAFQSPQDFLPHLIWLESDKSKACTCRHCNRPPEPTPVNGQLPYPILLKLMQADSNPASGLYRPGEMVWANPNDTYPVISIVASRVLAEGAEATYQLVPLKSPRIINRPPFTLPESRLRPWLSYTPPDPLQPSISQRKYQVKWAEINWQEWNRQDAELHDASIIASIRIACNIGITTCATETGEIIIPCLWLGAEKIWRNEEVRVMTPEIEGQKGMDVLVIKDITRDGNNGLFFQGNVYCKILHPLQPQQFPDPPPTPRMQQDAASIGCRWYLKYPNVQINAMEIKGRWYPSSVLRPIINPAAEPPDNTYYDVSVLLNNNTDIPNHSGGWRVSSNREEHVLGIGHLANNQPAGWINIDDWRRLYVDDAKQWTLETAPVQSIPVQQVQQAPTVPNAVETTKPAKKAATTRKTTTKRVSTKTKQTAQTVEEPPSEPKLQQSPAPAQAAAQAQGSTAPSEQEANRQQAENYDDNHEDDFLRQIEQDGADFEKAVQEGDPWAFYG